MSVLVDDVHAVAAGLSNIAVLLTFAFDSAFDIFYLFLFKFRLKFFL